MKIKHCATEPCAEQQNKAEHVNGTIKKLWKHWMVKKCMPRRPWDFVLAWINETHAGTAMPLDNKTGCKQTTGDAPNISEWLDFSACDWVWF